MDHNKAKRSFVSSRSTIESQDSMKPPRRQQEGREALASRESISYPSPANVKRRMTDLLKESVPDNQYHSAAGSLNRGSVSETIDSQGSIKPPRRQLVGRESLATRESTSHPIPTDVKRRMTDLLKESVPNSQDQAVAGSLNLGRVSEASGVDRDSRMSEAKDKKKSVVIEPVPGTSRYLRANLKVGPNVDKADRADQERVRKYAKEFPDHVTAVTSGMIPTLLITGAPHFRGFLGCYCVRNRSDGVEMVATFGSGAVKILTENGWVKRTLKAGSPYVLNPMMTVRYHPKLNNIVYAGGTEGRVYAFNSATAGPREQFCYQQGNSINSLDISIDGNILMTVGNDSAVRSYDTGTKELLASYASHPAFRSDEYNHMSRLFAVRRHPLTNSVFVTGGWDNRVMVWDVRVRNGYVTKFIGAHVCGEAIDIHENLIMTASWMRDRALRFWDLTAGKGWDPRPISNRPAQFNSGDYFYACQYFAGDPTGSLVMAGGSGIKGAMILDRSECMYHGIIPLKTALLALDTYSNRVVIGGVQNTVKIGEVRYYTEPPPHIDASEESSDDENERLSG